MKKIMIKILFTFVILFGISFKVKATVAYDRTNVDSIANVTNFDKIWRNTTSLASAKNDFEDINTWKDFYNSLIPYLYNKGWYVSQFPSFEDTVFVSSLTYYSNSHLSFSPFLMFCNKNNFSVVNVGSYSYFACSNDSTIIIDGNADGRGFRVRTAGSGQSNNLSYYSTWNVQYVKGFYTNSDFFTGYSIFNSYYSNLNIPITVLDTAPIIDDVYDKDFLENNSDWDKVCVDNQLSTFSFIPKNIDTSNNSLLNYYVLTNTFIENYDISFLQFDTSGNQFDINYDTEGSHTWWFTDTDLMYDLLDNDYYVQDFNNRYPNIYNSLLGWDLWLTRFQSTTSTSFIVQVFDFNNVYTKSLAPNCYSVGTNTYCSTDEGNIHGGGGRDHNLDNPQEYTCFYIPNTLEIRFWNTNDFGDIDDTITINGNDYNILTDEREQLFYGTIDSHSYSGFIGYFKTMLERLSVPIIFINSKISLFFSKLPQDIQYMIIGIISLGFLIGLIKFLTGGK